MKVLNLYAGIGGNRKLWRDCDVTAVEMEYKIAEVYSQQFPKDNVVIGDAHEYLLDHHEEYDFVWSSPPCQTHSRMAKATRHKLNRYSDMSLYQEILFLKHIFKGQWVVENVKPYYEPLISPTQTIGRHLFWSNYDFMKIEIQQPKGFINNSTVAGSIELKKWLGINYEGNIYYKNNHCPSQVLRNCVHPKLGEHIFNSKPTNH